MGRDPTQFLRVIGKGRQDILTPSGWPQWRTTSVWKMPLSWHPVPNTLRLFTTYFACIFFLLSVVCHVACCQCRFISFLCDKYGSQLTSSLRKIKTTVSFVVSSNDWKFGTQLVKVGRHLYSCYTYERICKFRETCETENLSRRSLSFKLRRCTTGERERAREMLAGRLSCCCCHNLLDQFSGYLIHPTVSAVVDRKTEYTSKATRSTV